MTSTPDIIVEPAGPTQLEELLPLIAAGDLQPSIRPAPTDAGI